MSIEVKIPDIGDFKNIPIIEILVKEGDTIGAEDPIVSLESDKATMEVPSPSAGVIEKILVKVGDTVSEGSPVLLLKGESEEKAPAAAAAATPSAGAAPSADTAALMPKQEPDPAKPAAPRSPPRLPRPRISRTSMPALPCGGSPVSSASISMASRAPARRDGSPRRT